MAAKLIKRTYMLLILTVLCLNPALVGMAEDCQTDGKSAPTPPGNVSYPEGWECEDTGAKPTIVSSDETIPNGGSITVWVDSGGQAHPPYTWELSGNGYSLNGTTTENDLEALTLTADEGTCGTDFDVYCTLKVTDLCGVEYEAQIRNSGGQWPTTWVGITTCEAAGESEETVALGGGSFYSYLTVGKYKYRQATSIDAVHTCWSGYFEDACGDTWCIYTGFNYEPCITDDDNYAVSCFYPPSKPCDVPFPQTGNVWCMWKTLYKVEWECAP